jgi:drug/metabolite transporter (DMT)-like permease
MSVLAKVAYAAGANVATVLASRFTIAAVCLWSWLLLTRRLQPLPLRTVAALAAMGACFAGNSFTFFGALEHIPAATAALLLYTYPALVALQAAALRWEPLTRRVLLALALALLGCALTLGVGTGPLSPRGVGLALASAAIYSVYVVASSRVMGGVAPALASAIVITSAGLIVGAWTVLTGQFRPDVAPAGWAAILIITFGSTVVAIQAFLAGVERIGAARAAILSTVEPVVTVLLAALILAEPLTASQGLGGLCILAAALLLRSPGRRDGGRGRP